MGAACGAGATGATGATAGGAVAMGWAMGCAATFGAEAFGKEVIAWLRKGQVKACQGQATNVS